ncbi:MAG: CDP-glucose 4,6-dehydratase [Chloroflexota bacterium]
MGFEKTFHQRRVLITGHTGFKGSWLSTWLLDLGAVVAGYSLKTPPTTPSNYSLCHLNDHVENFEGDVSDYTNLYRCIESFQPDVIFHMAAQPLVIPSLEEPRTTFDHNVMGTVNLLEAVRLTQSVRAVICITTDKVYANQEWVWGYREGDRLGGKDPYSASKAMAELAVDAYRQSFFRADWYDQHGVALATARAGNVIGGGDFAAYRLVPDCMAALMADKPIVIRNPAYVRPWQHVLVPLSGYLRLAQKLLNEGPRYAEAWNFGPPEIEGITTGQIADKLIKLWGSGSWINENPDLLKRETGRLKLSWEKGAERLNWQPVYDWQEALEEIVAWYRAYQNEENMLEVCRRHVKAFSEKFDSL